MLKLHKSVNTIGQICKVRMQKIKTKLAVTYLMVICNGCSKVILHKRKKEFYFKKLKHKYRNA